MCLSAKQQRELDRCEAARLEPPDLPEALFDSLESCMAERCGIDADCDDCVEKTCHCRDWRDEIKDDYSADDYAQKDDE